jgi:hypothetical protein
MDWTEDELWEWIYAVYLSIRDAGDGDEYAFFSEWSDQLWNSWLNCMTTTIRPDQPPICSYKGSPYGFCNRPTFRPDGFCYYHNPEALAKRKPRKLSKPKLAKLLLEAVDMLEAGQPPEGCKTDMFCKYVRSLIKNKAR